MSFIPATLIATGAIIVVISFFSSRHTPNRKGPMVINRLLADERIGRQLSGGVPRSDAKLGLWFGAFIIAAGIVWQAVVSCFWWGV